MFGKVRLSTKMGCAFGLLVAIAGLLGYVGRTGLNRMTRIENLNQKGNDCLASLTQCASLRKEFALRGFERDGTSNATAAENWRQVYDALTTQLQQLEKAADMSVEDRAIVTEALDKMPPYLTAFEHQKTARQMKDEAFAAWGTIGWDVTKEIATVTTEIIAPARQAAEEAKDADNLARWANLGAALDQTVLQTFLVLRVNAVYLRATNTAVQWTAYEKQLRTVKANAEESASASEELSSQAESMNDIVGELIALAGGANKGATSKTQRQQTKSRGLSHSDHMYHHIAEGTNKNTHSVSTRSAAAKTIPLGNDEELEHFNS